MISAPGARPEQHWRLAGADAGVILGPMLNPTPTDKMTDSRGRPYFLWDEEETTLTEFLGDVHSADSGIRAHALGKLMRQAKPDDVLQFVTPAQILADWERVRRFLGRSHPFWEWTVTAWQRLGVGADGGH